MKFPRALALAALAAVCSCHDDPEVITVVVNVLSNGLSVNAEGGSTSLSGLGNGGAGGQIAVTALGPVTAGTAPTSPADPPTPAQPAGAAAADPTGETAATGNLVVPTLTTTSDAIYAASNGDVVVEGTLQAGDNGGGQFNITLSAPNGTVYIVGTVRTSSADGTSNGDDAGTITINAARIVVSGSLDASGEDNAGGGGGDASDITLSSSAGSLVLHRGSSIRAAGGAGTVNGGTGRNVGLTAATSLHVFATITTSGGDANGPAVTPVGGDAGDLALAGGSAVDVGATLVLRGGASNDGGDGGQGGAGGDVTCDSLVHVRLFGSVDQRGGGVSPTAVSVGGLVGGTGGNLLLGQAGGVLSADLGLGTWSTSGGDSGTGGGAGSIRLESDTGAISVASDLVARGGDGFGPNSSNGGAGGAVTLQNDSDLTGSGSGNVGFHPITLLAEGSIVTEGGTGVSGGEGGTGGAIRIEGGGNLTVAGSLNSSGGAEGGAAAAILIQTSADSGTPVGNIHLTGAIRAEGRDRSGDSGGTGGDLTVLTDFAPGSGSITSSSAITLSGGTTGSNSAGGVGGALTFRTAEGDITLSGLITSDGGGGGATPSRGGDVVVEAGGGGGSILFAAALSVDGGGSTALATSGVAGARGGNVDMICGHPAGFIALTTGASISADGGASTGVLIGGTGGELRFLTDGAFVSITAAISARGGPALGTTGFGGLGGAVQVHTNTTAGGPGGDITLAAGSTLDVSGGTGPTAGAARNNAGAGITDGDIDLVAVQLDADGDLATSGANAPDGGIVVNSGTITAGGLVAGDILFDGRDATGAAVTAPLPGSISPAPGASGTTFEGQ